MLKRTELKHMLLIFITCLTAYLLFWSGVHYSIDGIVMFEYAKVLLFQHSFQMSTPIFWADKEIRSSVWSLGLTFTYLPYLMVFSALFPSNALYRQIPYDPHNPYNPLLLENSPYRYASLVHPAITALTAVMVYVLARQLGLSKKAACGAALIFGLASPAAPYAKYDFAQPLVSLLLIGTFVSYLWNRQQKPIFLSLTGFLLGLTILTRPEMVIIAGIPFCILVLWSQLPSDQTNGTSWKYKVVRLFSIAIPMVSFILLLLFTNEQRFGSPFSTGFMTVKFNLDISLMLAAVVGTIASPARGILIFFPLSLLSLLGIPNLLHRDREVGFLTAYIIVASILVYSSWIDWGGGTSWGPRFLVPILPYITILALTGYERLRAFSPVMGSVVFITLLFLGWAGNLQGQLFNSMKYVTNRTMFNLSAAPIFSGWDAFLSPSSYDIFWAQKIRSGQSIGYLIPPMLISLLVICAYFWLKLFLSIDEGQE